MTLTDCIQTYFDQYLRHIKGASDQTIISYRQCFTLFLQFAAYYHNRQVKQLEMEDLTGELIFTFLNHLEESRKNSARSRNHRLAAIKSLAKMIRLLYPEHQHIAKMILNIPQKRYQKRLIGFFNHYEAMQIFAAVDLKKKDGFLDYAILHLLYDSGARASEVTTLTLNDFDQHKHTLVILGKGNRHRQIELWPKTVQIMGLYIKKHRRTSRPQHQNVLFLNQRSQPLTRHGIYRICKKHIEKCFSPKRLTFINPAHSFRHSCAVNMLLTGSSLTDIKNRLGHENIQSTMVYLHMNLGPRKKIIKHLTCLLARLPRYMRRHISRYAQAHVPCRRTKIRRNLV